MLTTKLTRVNQLLSIDMATIVTVTLISMIAPLNSTMIAVALPQIMVEFHSDVGRAGWLVTAYLLTMASLQPIAGKLGDRWGYRRLILAGLVWFTLASLGAPLAPTLPILLLWRVQQAIAAALTLPNAVALIRAIAPAAERGKWFGSIGAATSLAAATGPLLGGLLVGLAGWRMVFYVNLLLVMPALLLGWWALPTPRTRPAERPFDLAGATLLATCLLGLVWLLTMLRTHGALASGHWLSGALLLGMGIALLFWWERHHAAPILPLHFFRHRAFAATNGAIALSNLAMYVTLLALPLLLSAGHWTSGQIGLVLAAFSGGSAFFAPVGGRLADRWGRRWPTVGGLTLLAIGLLPLALPIGTEAIGTYLPLFVIGLAVAGIGLGISAAGLQTTAVEAVEARQTGVAAGVFSTSRYLGSITGSVLLATLLAGAGNTFQPIFLLVAVAAWLAVIVSLFLQDRPTVARSAP